MPSQADMHISALHRSLAMVIIVMRSKLVLDFALSTHVIHLVFVVLYTRQLPRHAMWWACMAASSALAVGLGTWGCRYRELKPISFGGGGGGVSATNGSSGEGSSSGGAGAGDGDAGADDDEEQGYSRGRGRVRGRDGAGEYEMVAMKGDTIK